VPYEGGLDFALVVDNLPIVDISKKEKLIQTLEKRFAKVGPASTENGIYMPWDEQLDTSKGYVRAVYQVVAPTNQRHLLDMHSSNSIVPKKPTPP
jgi:translation initiation factor 3 subunit B